MSSTKFGHYCYKLISELSKLKNVEIHLQQPMKVNIIVIIGNENAQLDMFRTKQKIQKMFIYFCSKCDCNQNNTILRLISFGRVATLDKFGEIKSSSGLLIEQWVRLNFNLRKLEAPT